MDGGGANGSVDDASLAPSATADAAAAAASGGGGGLGQEADEDRRFFLAVRTHGVGGATGWGVLLHEAQTLLRAVGAVVDGHMNTLGALKKQYPY